MDTTPLLACREIPWGGAEYRELVRLRDLHLRQPIGLRLNASDRAGEETQRHFALASEEGEIIGGLIAILLGGSSAKLRQMWVAPSWQGHGLGALLLRSVEETLVAEGVRRFTLHARQDATGFYRKSGYRAYGEIVIEVGRPHQPMEKALG